VGPPTTCLETEASVVDAKDCEEIYDDVMPPSLKQDSLKVDKSDYLIPKTGDEVSCKVSPVELRATSKSHVAEMPSRFSPTANDDQYFSTMNNEYYSVDCESHLGEKERDKMGVYDDVGLSTGEERINSLYVGSTSGSVLGLTSMNGKESEWEDLEETSYASRCPCQTNPW